MQQPRVETHKTALQTYKKHFSFTKAGVTIS